MRSESDHNPSQETTTHLRDSDADLLADGAGPLQHDSAGSEETRPAPQEAPQQQIHHLLQGARAPPSLSGGCWEKKQLFLCEIEQTSNRR